jgi:hypothetical protein
MCSSSLLLLWELFGSGSRSIDPGQRPDLAVTRNRSLDRSGKRHPSQCQRGRFPFFCRSRPLIVGVYLSGLRNGYQMLIALAGAATITAFFYLWEKLRIVDK